MAMHSENTRQMPMRPASIDIEPLKQNLQWLYAIWNLKQKTKLELEIPVVTLSIVSSLPPRGFAVFTTINYAAISINLL